MPLTVITETAPVPGDSGSSPEDDLSETVNKAPVSEPAVAESHDPDLSGKEQISQPKVLVEDMLKSTETMKSKLQGDIAHLSARRAARVAWGYDASDLDSTIAQKEEELREHQDMLDYLKGRDYQDKNGQIHDAKTGRFKREGDANKSKDDYGNETKSYSEMSLEDLVDKWAQAEINDDKTMSGDVQDEILERLEKGQGFSEDHKARLIDTVHKQMLDRKKQIQSQAVDPDIRSSEVTITVDPDMPESHISQTDDNPETKRNDEDRELPSPNPETDGNPETKSNEEDGGLPSPNPETDDNPETKRNKEDGGLPLGLYASDQCLTEQAKNRYKEVALRYAQAKLKAERMLATSKDQQELEASGNALAIAFNDFMGENEKLAGSIPVNGPEEDGSEGTTVDDESTKQEQENLKKVARVQAITELHKSVEDAISAERIKRHPKLASINNWLMKHKYARLATGGVLLGLGVLGGATLNAPIVGVAVAGSSLLRAYGAYNGGRAVGEMLANRQLSKHEISTIQDYLAASSRQSTHRRWSKRYSTALAAVAALAQPMLHVIDSGQVVTTHPATPSLSTQPSLSHSASVINNTPAPINITPAGGNMLPWTYGMDVLHTNISNPSILRSIVQNPYGIKFTGNGQGGGAGAILRVFIPGQGSFSDSSHINGAINYILNNG